MWVRWKLVASSVGGGAKFKTLRNCESRVSTAHDTVRSPYPPRRAPRHSHPSVKPCDLHPKGEYLWGYEPLLPKGQRERLERSSTASTHTLQVWSHHLSAYLTMCGGRSCPKTKERIIRKMLEYYIIMYNISITEDWWGWKFSAKSGEHDITACLVSSLNSHSQFFLFWKEMWSCRKGFNLLSRE